MTAKRKELLELADSVEGLRCGDNIRTLNREVALAIGWRRYSPSEIGKSSPRWIAPEDYIGEYMRKDGKRTPKLDSLHGTEIWREPRNYLGSVDAAMQLAPKGDCLSVGQNIHHKYWLASLNYLDEDGEPDVRSCGTSEVGPAIAIVAATLRWLAMKETAE